MKTIILGIDPGSRITGYGVIATNGSQHRFVACGCIKTQGSYLADKLAQIHQGISEIIRVHQPTTSGIEQVFMHQNPNSALKLGQARGAAIVALATQAIPVAEYAPRQIKKAVVGYGAADKAQIQQMVKLLLSLDQVPSPDAADALAIAICHAHSASSKLNIRG